MKAFILTILLFSIELSANDKFLNAISMIESSGGKNLNHRELKHGIHKGDRAIGIYGLMPNTILDLMNQRKKYNRFLTPLKGLNKNLIVYEVKNRPLIQYGIAKTLANYLLKKHKDPYKAAHAWHYGHNLSKISRKDLNNNYLKKFRKYYETETKECSRYITFVEEYLSRATKKEEKI